MAIRPGDIVAETGKDLNDKDRLGLVTDVDGDTITVRRVRVVPFGKKQEVPYSPFTSLLLVVARTGKKKAGP